MKLLWLFLALGVAHIIHQTCAQVTGDGGERLSAIHGGITRFPDEDILDVGVARVHAIAHGDQQVGEHLIEQLQADGQTTGEIACPQLTGNGARSPLQLQRCFKTTSNHVESTWLEDRCLIRTPKCVALGR